MVQERITLQSRFSRETTFALAITVTLTLGFVLVLVLSGGKPSTIGLFPIAVIFVASLLSFEFSLAALVVVLFADYHVGGLSLAVWYALPLGLSFLIRFKSVAWEDISNPLTIPMLVYGVSVVPSLWNATQPLTSIFMLVNVASFAVVLHVLIPALSTHDDVRKFVSVYLAMVLANALHVIIMSLAGQSRPFGFGGIMFVDYVGLGISVAVAMSVVSRGKTRLLLLVLTTIFSTALVLTQTRTIWLATAITLAFLGVYILLRPQVAGMPRKRLIVMIIAGSLVVAGVNAIVVSMNPRLEKRATELTKEPEYGIDEWGGVENSLVTRLLIWDTALNAFSAHPFVGIGVYGFPYSSKLYYKIPTLLYQRYVKDLSPHQTHLAVLSETGLIGALGFVVFLLAVLRCTFHMLRRASGIREMRYAFVAAVGVVYSLVSMLFTDAWLWGQGIVLLGSILGVMLANRKIAGQEVKSRE
jgi:O-antigen ligase